MRRKLLFITGTRADFGKLKALIAKVKDSDQFDYAIFVTGMHMLSRYGSTFIEVQKAGFENIYPYINQDATVNSQMDLALASTISGLGHYIREHPVELIIVHGDRIEALAGAIVGALNNILVAHIEGGEVSGTVDELLRHAISKLSHIHFVSNKQARDRLIQMGELGNAVFVIGSPDIDIMLSKDLPTLEDVKRKYEIAFDDYSIFMFHPITTELDDLKVKIESIVNALEESRQNFVMIYPNNDQGADVILESFKQLKNNPRFRIIPSMRFEYFLMLLKHSNAIVGNSSAGIREAPVYGVPTINIGNRQSNRFNYSSIINVLETKDGILKALKNLPCSIEPSLHFGDGHSAELFMEHLSSSEFWQISHQKQFVDTTIIEDVTNHP